MKWQGGEVEETAGPVRRTAAGVVSRRQWATSEPFMFRMKLVVRTGQVQTRLTPSEPPLHPLPPFAHSAVVASNAFKSHPSVLISAWTTFS